MAGERLDGFAYTFDELSGIFARKYGKGSFHSGAFFKHIYRKGHTQLSGVSEFVPAEVLAGAVERDFYVSIPDVQEQTDNSGTLKFALAMEDGSFTESVVIPMAEWDTLCVSSQVGCARACRFCETGRIGLVRNLKTQEIVSQWAAVRFRMNRTPRNIVFMGMGEPFDNFNSVIKAVDILSDQRGAAIPKRRISISTAGHVDGIRRLSELEKQHPERAYRTLHLAVSLNAPNDSIRNSIMPINRTWPMRELRSALSEAPQSRIKDSLYFEYVLIKGVNDSIEHAEQIIEWMDGLTAKVNLISYHPTGNTGWSAPDTDTVNRFHEAIRSAGRECRTRQSRGRGIEAACGMLGKKNLSDSSFSEYLHSNTSGES